MPDEEEREDLAGVGRGCGATDKARVSSCTGADDHPLGQGPIYRLDTLPDKDMCLRLRQSHPPILQQAALELESYAMASRRSKSVQGIHLERSSSHQKEASHAEPGSEPGDCFQTASPGLQSALHNCCTALLGDLSAPSRQTHAD